MRTHVYVDGFNFYYGCVKGTPFKWLNFSELFRRLLPPNDVRVIKYFTARVEARPGDPDQATRQDAYFRALQTLPTVEIVLGQFLTHPVTLPRADGMGYETVLRTEEKGSDVNLAAHLLHDAHRGLIDCAVIVSNDSDLAEPQETAVDGSASCAARRRRASPSWASETGTDAGSAAMLSQIFSRSASRSGTLSLLIASVSSLTMSRISMGPRQNANSVGWAFPCWDQPGRPDRCGEISSFTAVPPAPAESAPPRGPRVASTLPSLMAASATGRAPSPSGSCLSPVRKPLPRSEW